MTSQHVHARQGLSADASASGTTMVVGTFGYMAPEQFRGAAQPASDLYSLGATLLFLLTGGVLLRRVEIFIPA